MDPAVPLNEGPSEEPALPPSAPCPALPPMPWPEPIVVPTWRWRVWINPGTWVVSIATVVVMLILAAITAVAIFLALAAVEHVGLDGDLETAASIVAVLLVVGVAVLVARDVMRRAARGTASAFVSQIPASDPARAFMLAELSENGPPKDTWGAWHVQRWLDRVREGHPARAFVSAHLAERTARYDRTDRPVEPEEVGGGLGRGDVSRIVACGLAGGAAAWGFGWANIMTIGCAIVVALSVFRMVRRRSMFAPVVAGQGWVQHGSARWNVRDSVMTASGWANARVCIVGPKGVLVLRLRTARHQDLEALWVRWMHPDPRPDQAAFGD